MTTINKKQAADLMTKAGSTIFTAEFIKKNGEVRSMNCRRHVKKGVTGEGMSYDPYSRGLYPVFDMQKDAFRMLNLNTLRKLTVRGTTYTVDPDAPTE